MNQPRVELLRAAVVEEMTSFSKDKIDRMERAGEFPRRLRFGRAIRWRRSELEEWMASRPPAC